MERRPGIAALHAAFLRGDLRPSDHLASRLRRIEQRNPDINAVVALCEDRARREANASDVRFATGRPLGPLDGITVGIKDTFDVEGVPTTFGSPLFKDNLPERDCLSVRRLVDAGAVIIGKTNTSEFAAGAHTTNDLFGPTRNPRNRELSPGGSTGGGAAGVADGMFDLALGSDLGGSLRVPAAFCGVLGIRPTPGLVPKSPDNVPFDEMSVDGLIGRSASDLAFGLDVIAWPHPSDPKSPPADWQPRFAESLSAGGGQIRNAAFFENFSSVPVAPDILRICRSAVMDMFPMVDQPQIDLESLRDAYLALRAQHVLNANLHLLDNIETIGPNISSNIREGMAQSSMNLAQAEFERSNIWNEVSKLFERYDLILSPCTTISPFPIEGGVPISVNGYRMAHYIDWIAPTFLFSMLGLPGVSVPVGLDDGGMPVGLQIVGPRHSEKMLLKVAGVVGQATEII